MYGIKQKAREYSARYSSEDISALFDHAVNLIDIDIEAALQKFNEGITERFTVCRELL